MASKYPPYVNAYGKIPDVFEAIKIAAVPPKFTYDYLHTVLGLKSSSYRAMIPLLKKLGFLDDNSVPTQRYKDYRDDDKSGFVLAEAIKETYPELYKASEYAHKLEKDEIQSKLKTLLGVADDDQYVPNVASTFLELVALADFQAKKKTTKKTKTNQQQKEDGNSKESPISSFETEDFEMGISYTINLNLPATTEIEVFNAIFKSLRENLLKK